MDEFDVAKFLEDESLLAELVGDILQQLQTPFVEQRLANGFKEDLIEERDELINELEGREEQISMLLQLFYSLTEVGVAQINQVNGELEAVEAEMENAALEHETMRNQIQKLQEQQSSLEQRNGKLENELEKLNKACEKSRAEAEMIRKEIEDVMTAEKRAEGSKRIERRSTVSNFGPALRQLDAKTLQKKNSTLEKTAFLLTEELNRLKLKKEQEDYYKEVYQITENELNEMRKVFDDEIPSYEAKIKAFGDLIVDLEMELADFGPVPAGRRTVSNAEMDRAWKSVVNPERRRRKSSGTYTKGKPTFIIEEIEEATPTKRKTPSISESKGVFNEKIQIRNIQVNDLSQVLDYDCESDDDGDDHATTPNRNLNVENVRLIGKRNLSQDDNTTFSDKQQAVRHRREHRRILSMAVQEQQEKEAQFMLTKGQHKARNLSYGDTSAFLLPNLSTSATDLDVHTAKNSTPEVSIRIPISGVTKTIEKVSVGTQTVDLEPSINKETKSVEQSPTSNVAAKTRKRPGPTRREPIREFFSMTCQCAKLNSLYFDQIIHLPTEQYYDQLVEEKIPFHKWYKWIQRTLEEPFTQKTTSTLK